MATLLKDLFAQSIQFLSEKELFYGHGVEMAEDEVVLLMMSVFSVDFSELNQMSDVMVSDDQVSHVQQILEQRVSSKTPMAYLVGFSIFAGLRFSIDERALIPRSPFVELIDNGFKPWVDLMQESRVLDMCTGSGCIGLAIAHYFEHCHVDLADLSKDALQLAKENRQAQQLNGRVDCILSDLFDQVQEKYRLIVANPPYVDAAEYNDLPEEFSHEPKMALVSDHQGMEIPIRILAQAADYLNDNGFLFLEVGYNDEVLINCLPDVSFQWVKLRLGGQGICVFSRADLLKYRTKFEEYLKTHVA